MEMLAGYRTSDSQISEEEVWRIKFVQSAEDRGREVLKGEAHGLLHSWGQDWKIGFEGEISKDLKLDFLLP